MIVSFILGTRNDGYGGLCPAYGDYTMRRLELTLQSIKRINIEGVECEVVVVEWCPDDNKRIPSHICPDPIIVPTEVNKLLNQDGNNSISFYEYVAKHIGAIYARGDILCLCNPDNIFPQDGIQKAIDAAASGQLAIATRKDIGREYSLVECDDLLKLIKENRIHSPRQFETAGGDFTMIGRSEYWRLGGYPLCHGAWDVDNWFIRHAEVSGVPATRCYTHYHIDHDNSTTEVSGRPKGSVETYQQVSDGSWSKIVDIMGLTVDV